MKTFVEFLVKKMDKNIFSKNIEDLIPIFKTQKSKLTQHLEKNYRENHHYIKLKHANLNDNKQGGKNKITFLLTCQAFNLIKTSFRWRSGYISALMDIKVNNIFLPLEGQTIGFIYNCYKDIVDVIKQVKFDKYSVDLYFKDYKLILECDEDDHKDRDTTYENKREIFLVKQGNCLIRFNPSDINFDLSELINEINNIIIKNKQISNVVKLPRKIVTRRFSFIKIIDYYDPTKKIKSINFDLTRLGFQTFQIKFDNFVSEEEAVKKVENWLSQPVTKEYLDNLNYNCDILYLHNNIKIRGDLLGDKKYLENFECIEDNDYKISLGS